MRTNDKKILAVLSSEPISANEAGRRAGMDAHPAYKAMHRLRQSGHAVNISTGYPSLYVLGIGQEEVPDPEYIPVTMVAGAIARLPELQRVWA